MKGIDLSHHNGHIDWKTVCDHDAEMRRVYLKASEGVGYTDPVFLENAEGCRANGIPFGAYHFATLNDSDTTNDAVAEAIYFDKTMKKVQGISLPPVLDIERNKANLSPFQVQNWVQAFIDKMNDLGYPEVIIYSYTPFLDSNLPHNHDFGKHKLWIAAYTRKPKMPIGWTSIWMWQHSCTGVVPGIKGRVDLNSYEEENPDQKSA